MPAGTPEPPAHLSPGAKQEFFRVVQYLSQVNGLLTPTDHAGIGIYCSLYDQWQQAELAIPTLSARHIKLEAERDKMDATLMTVTKRTSKVQVDLLRRQRDQKSADAGRVYNSINVAIGERNRARKEMRGYLSELGLTPAARTRIRVNDGQMPLPGMGAPARAEDPLETSRRQLTGA